MTREVEARVTRALGNARWRAAVESFERAQTLHESALEDAQRIAAQQHQLIVDAEVNSSRRRLHEQSHERAPSGQPSEAAGDHVEEDLAGLGALRLRQVT
jgi:hypothetical protein